MKRQGSPNPSPHVKRAVIRRDNGLCVLRLDGCTGEAQTTDHRANRGSGGSRILNDPANLIGACTSCNGLKADSSGYVRIGLIRRGILVIPSSTHEKTLTRAKETPVIYPDGVSYRLIDTSTREPWVTTKEE